MAEDFELVLEEDEEKEDDDGDDEDLEFEEDANEENSRDSKSQLSKESEENNEVEVSALQEQFFGAMAELRLDEKKRIGTLTKDISEKECSESVSGFSCISGSTVSTIAPEVIKQRLMKSYQKGDKATAKKRIRAKGEASAVTRQRRDNFDNIRQSTGIWGHE